jgi:dTDP-4-amino-4,6-dideoxygalactose transaminase
LALLACGIGPGDAVLTVSHTAVATAAAIEIAGAVPVFADIDPQTFTLDPASAEDAIRKFRGPRIKAMIPVHLYGHAADMRALLDIAARHELHVIEDCAQSHGTALDGKKTGTFGPIAAFSFYPTKNLGALGDGGAIVTSDPDLAENVRLLREYGWKERYVSDRPGINSRLDEMQAAILRVKLRSLDTENCRRRTLAARYDSSLRGVGLPVTRPGVTHAYHQYVIRSDRRDELRAFLGAHGIGTLVHYPVPIHLQPAYCERLRPVVPLDGTEQAAREILSLPMFPELSEEQIDRVCRAIGEL